MRSAFLVALAAVLAGCGATAAAWYRPGAPCPPNARCVAPPPGNAYVVVRLDGALIRFVPLRIEGDIVVGVPDVASFDLWPPSGEAIPAVGRPDGWTRNETVQSAPPSTTS